MHTCNGRRGDPIVKRLLPVRDPLALARQSWVGQMADGLRAMGYRDYGRSDAAAVRLRARGPASIGRLGEVLGVTRQAARKVVDGLERRGLAATARDHRDARQVNVFLTPEGAAYAEAVVAVIGRLDRDLVRRVDPADLAGAVLRAVLADDRARRLAARLAGNPLRPQVVDGTWTSAPAGRAPAAAGQRRAPARQRERRPS